MPPRVQLLLLLLCLGCGLAVLRLLSVAPQSALRAAQAAAPLAEDSAAQEPIPERRACFSRAADYKAPLKGHWRAQGGASSQHYAEVLGDRQSLRKGNVNAQVAEQWAQRACPLEDAVHSCYYHGEERAGVLAARDFVAEECDLPHFDGAKLLESAQNTDVFFVGDSIMRQLWQSVGCHLRNFIVNVDVNWISMSWQGRGNCPFVNATHCYSFGPDCVVVSSGGTGMKLCYLMSHPDMSLDHWIAGAHMLKMSPTSRELVLFNGGIHFNSGQEERYLSFLQKIVEGAHEIRKGGGRFIWLETTPQHFPTLDGQYNHSAKGGVCAPLASRRSSWRNDMANTLMSDQGFEILYTFENARSQWDAHVGDTYRDDQLYESGDCSHFCLPGVPDLWTRILFSMLSTVQEAV